MTLRLASLAQGTARLRDFVASAQQVRGRDFVASAQQAVMTVVFVLIAGSASLLACPLCFGAEETSLVDGTKLGVLVMVGITLVVQGGFVGFFLYLRRRAKRMAELELETEWSELQRARTS
jgi:heme/copper-type cytochrome/quinol oxidase subunit 2